MTVAQHWAARGYMRASEVARRTGLARSTITRWVDAGLVVGERSGDQLWVMVESMKAKLGSAGAVLDGESEG